MTPFARRAIAAHTGGWLREPPAGRARRWCPVPTPVAVPVGARLVDLLTAGQVGAREQDAGCDDIGRVLGM